MFRYFKTLTNYAKSSSYYKKKNLVLIPGIKLKNILIRYILKN